MTRKRSVRLYNSRTRRVEDFFTLGGGRLARMYSCGPTVYASAHLGNLRAYVFADTLRRALLWAGYDVEHVINVTDVGHIVGDGDVGADKVASAAKALGVTVHDVTHRYFGEFAQDLDRLRVLPPKRWSWASKYVSEMIEFAQSLDAKGFTYRLPSGLYFDTRRVAGYGAMAAVDLSGLVEGARIGVVEGRRHPTDFALWRSVPKDDARLLSWDSPWGRGAPGWHLECSVMSMETLGRHYEIHTGGIDHINVHHANEIAQSEAYLDDGRPWVPFWLHGEFLLSGDEKIAKSGREALTLSQLMAGEGIHPLAFRWYLLGSHYRSQLSFNITALKAADRSLTRLSEWFLDRARELAGPATQRVEAPRNSARTRTEIEGTLSHPAGLTALHELDRALTDDLATPRALAVVASLRHRIGDQEAELSLWNDVVNVTLGVDLISHGLERVRQRRPTLTPSLDVERIETVLTEREAARRAKDFDRADRLRDQLFSLGAVVADTPRGSVWTRHHF